MLKQIALIALLGAILIPCVNAVPGPATNECDNYRHQAVVAIALQVQAGDNEVWGSVSGHCGIVRSNTQVLLWSGQYSGPVFLAPAVVTWVVGDAFTGCTLSAFTINTNTILGNAGSIASARVTMTSNECRGSIVFTISIAGVYSWNAIFPVNLQVEQPYPTTFSVTNTGTINSVLSGTVNTVVSGTLGLTGTLNVVNSGGQNIAITSWPTLLATLSGGLTITDDANGWAIHQDPLSGTVNVVNSGGQSIAVTSWPTLLATLSGNLNVHQDEACGNPTHCLVDLTGLNATITGNFTGSGGAGGFVFPILFTLFILLLLLAEWKQDAMWFILAALVGVLSVSAGEFTGNSVLIIVAIIVYAIFRAYHAMGHFTFRNSDDEEDDDQ